MLGDVRDALRDAGYTGTAYVVLKGNKSSGVFDTRTAAELYKSMRASRTPSGYRIVEIQMMDSNNGFRFD